MQFKKSSLISWQDLGGTISGSVCKKSNQPPIRWRDSTESPKRAVPPSLGLFSCLKSLQGVSLQTMLGTSLRHKNKIPNGTKTFYNGQVLINRFVFG